MHRFLSFLATASLLIGCSAGRSLTPAPSTGLLTPRHPQTTTPSLFLPNLKDSLKMAIVGDTGTGKSEQYEVANQMVDTHQFFPFDTVLMLGDNLYGGEGTRDYEDKFALPYRGLLDAGVKFYAALGNHDKPDQRFYDKFHMSGKRYYTFTKKNVRFFALDSNYMDEEQLKWLEEELEASNSDWKICFFHHPLYSSGERHGSDVALRKALEPLFVKYGVNVVFSGHEHFYERLNPQKGIYYFISGSAAKLRSGNIDKKSNLTAKGFDTDYEFMTVEIADDRLYFQVLSREGETVDSGEILRQQVQEKLPSEKPSQN